MSGKITVAVRRGNPKRNDLHYFPYATLFCQDENSSRTVVLSPTIDDMEKVLRALCEHEAYLNMSVNKNADKRFIEMLQKVVAEYTQKQLSLANFAIPAIYREAVKQQNELKMEAALK